MTWALTAGAFASELRRLRLWFAESRADHGLENFEDSLYPYERYGRHVGTRTPDLYRVNFEVNNLKPFPYLAFPRPKSQRTLSEIPSFDGELMASSRLLRPAGARLLTPSSQR